MVETALATSGLRVRRAMQLGSTEAIKQAVAAGLGLSIVSRAAAADQLALGRIAEVKIEGLTIVRRFTQLRVSGRLVSAPVRAFEAHLREAAAPEMLGAG